MKFYDMYFFISIQRINKFFYFLRNDNESESAKGDNEEEGKVERNEEKNEEEENKHL